MRITNNVPTIFSGSIKIISAKLSRSGSPLVVLATRHAFLFDMSLKCWLRVADDCFPASNFASSWSLGSTQSGELAALQVDVRKFLARKPGWTRYVMHHVKYLSMLVVPGYVSILENHHLPLTATSISVYF